MRIVGVQRSASEVDTAQLSEDGTTLSVMTDVANFWSAPQEWIARPPIGGKSCSPMRQRLLPPSRPDAQVLCVGLNYKDHALEGSYRDQPLPPFPTIFGRWTRSLSVNGTEIPVPAGEDGLDWEGEVVAWVGRPLVEATTEEALTAVFGYSAFNDITARRAQKLTSQWSLGKNADRSGAIGPIVPASEVGDISDGLRIRTLVNGERAKIRPSYAWEMIYSVGVRPRTRIANDNASAWGSFGNGHACRRRVRTQSSMAADTRRHCRGRSGVAGQGAQQHRLFRLARAEPTDINGNDSRARWSIGDVGNACIPDNQS